MLPAKPYTSLRRLSAAVEPALLSLGIAVFFVCGYFGVGHYTRQHALQELALPIDRDIPFIPGSIWIYLWMFLGALAPAFLIRCPRLLRRAAAAYFVAIAVSLVCFAAFPVSSRALRVPREALDMRDASQWAVALVYALDPPRNLFPSLHLSIVSIAAFSLWKADRNYGLAGGIGVLAVAVSVCTTKQHFVSDALGGLLLAALTCAWLVQPYTPNAAAESRRTRRGLIGYVALVVCFYAGCYLAFLSSLQQTERDARKSSALAPPTHT